MRACLCLALVCVAAVSRGDTTVLDAPQGEPLIGVVASRTRGGPLAVWSEGHVLVSRDGGQSFARHGLRYLSVAVAGDRVYWRDGEHLFIDTPRGIETRELPKLGQLFDLVGGGKWLALIAKDKVVITDDDGKTWRDLEVPGRGNFGEELVIEDDGALQWMTGSEAACGGGHQSRVLGKIGGAWREAPWPLDSPGDFLIAPGGWAYAVDNACVKEGERLCAVGGGKAIAVTPTITKSVALAHDGRTTIIASDGRLYRLRGTHATDLGTAPDDTTALALTADTTYAIAAGHLHARQSTTWRQLR
jgi:hypothetical protein